MKDQCLILLGFTQDSKEFLTTCLMKEGRDYFNKDKCNILQKKKSENLTAFIGKRGDVP